MNLNKTEGLVIKVMQGKPLAYLTTAMFHVNGWVYYSGYETLECLRKKRLVTKVGRNMFRLSDNGNSILVPPLELLEGNIYGEVANLCKTFQ
jgi:hypothetical protein